MSTEKAGEGLRLAWFRYRITVFERVLYPTPLGVLDHRPKLLEGVRPRHAAGQFGNLREPGSLVLVLTNLHRVGERHVIVDGLVCLRCASSSDESVSATVCPLRNFLRNGAATLPPVNRSLQPTLATRSFRTDGQ